MPQLLHIVSASGQPGNGNLAAAVGGVRPRRKAGAGRIGIHAKPPAGEILTVLCGLGQADGSRIWGFQLEIGIKIAAGSAGERYRCLIAGTRHIPDVIGGACSGRQVPGSPIHSGGRNRSRLRDVQGISTLVELSAAAVCEGEIGQNAVAVIDAGFFSCHRDSRSAPAGCGSEAGNLFCRLNCIHKRIVVGSEVRNTCSSGIVENIAGGAALVRGIALKCGGIPQAADDLVNEELSCDSQRHIGIIVLFRGGHADRVVPHLIAVQQDQTNGFPPCGGQSVPHIAAGCAAAAVQGHIPVNGVAGGAGCVAAPRLNAVQRIVRIGNAAVPSKVPAHVLDIGSPSRAAAVRFVSAGHLRIEDGGVIAIVRIIKQHNAVLRTGN